MILYYFSDTRRRIATANPAGQCVCRVYIIVVSVATLRVLDGIACCVVALLYYMCQTRGSTSPWRPKSATCIHKCGYYSDISMRYINYRAAEKSRALGKSTDVCIEVAGMSHNLGGSPVWLLLPGVRCTHCVHVEP